MVGTGVDHSKGGAAASSGCLHLHGSAIGGVAIDTSPVTWGKLETEEFGGHGFADVAYEVAVKGEVQGG